jgi:hypothetical protein
LPIPSIRNNPAKTNGTFFRTSSGVLSSGMSARIYSDGACP